MDNISIPIEGYSENAFGGIEERFIHLIKKNLVSIHKSKKKKDNCLFGNYHLAEVKYYYSNEPKKILLLLLYITEETYQTLLRIIANKE